MKWREVGEWVSELVCEWVSELVCEWVSLLNQVKWRNWSVVTGDLSEWVNDKFLSLDITGNFIFL